MIGCLITGSGIAQASVAESSVALPPETGKERGMRRWTAQLKFENSTHAARTSRFLFTHLLEVRLTTINEIEFGLICSLAAGALWLAVVYVGAV